MLFAEHEPPCRAEPDQAEPSRAEPGRAEPGRVEPKRASASQADPTPTPTLHARSLPMPYNLCLMKADHTIVTRFGTDAEPAESHPLASFHVRKDMLLIREYLQGLRPFGLRWKLPSFISDAIVTHVSISGPQNICFLVDLVLFSFRWRFRGYFSLLPLDAFRQRAEMVMYADPQVPWLAARVLHWWIKETALQDAEVWEHKINVAPKNVVRGDGPFAGYGKWLEQFYSDKSISWEQYRGGKSLDW